MASREYREREHEQQKTRRRSRSPDTSYPGTKTKPSSRVDHPDGGKSSISGNSSTEFIDRLRSTRDSDQSLVRSRKSGQHSSIHHLPRDERRRIWIVKKRWGGHPRYPDYDPAESSADEEELTARKNLLQEMLDKQKASETAREAEKERRRNIGPDARAVEDGNELIREIEADDNKLVLLEESRSNRAQCQASECIFVELENENGRYIMDKFRIYVKDRWRGHDRKRYYHEICFERMIALEKLPDAKFLMDGGPWFWGLMIRQWFENRGCINLDKIAEYMEAKDQYDKEFDTFSDEMIIWDRKHQTQCKAETGACGCPPKPLEPEEPVLTGYKTSKEEVCSLAEVLDHSRCDDMYEKLWMETGIYGGTG